MRPRTIYLDHHATTPMLPEVWDAMRPYALEAFGNPSSSHSVGRQARRGLEDAREQVAALLDAHPDEVVFTSGATEANNLALLGIVRSVGRGPIVASPIEHPCITEPIRHLVEQGYALHSLPIDPQGRAIIDADVPATPAVATLMLVNHETGVIQPVRELVERCAGAPVHCDAVQAIGKLPVSFRELGATTLSLSAHKFGGPKGVGALLVRRNTKLKPRFWGGHQQQDRRPGTESAMLAVGLATALRVAVTNQAVNHSYVEQLRDHMWKRLNEVFGNLRLNGCEDPMGRVPHVLNVSFAGRPGDVLMMKFDLAGIACSTGSACSSGSLLASPVLQAMGVPAESLTSAIRFSFAPTTSLADIDEAIERAKRL